LEWSALGFMSLEEKGLSWSLVKWACECLVVSLLDGDWVFGGVALVCRLGEVDSFGRLWRADGDCDGELDGRIRGWWWDVVLD
jgi:hypothetical protein